MTRPIGDVLAPLPYPCCHPPYRGNANRYVTYQLIGQAGAVYAEGAEAETGVRYMVHVWCAGSGVFPMMQEVKAALESGGYIVTVDTEIYEKESRMHRIVLQAETEGAVYG